jgi:hypothetical protein
MYLILLRETDDIVGINREKNIYAIVCVHIFRIHEIILSFEYIKLFKHIDRRSINEFMREQYKR